MFNITLTVAPDADTKRILESIAVTLREIEFWQRPRLRPGMVHVISKGQISMTKFAYTFALPAVSVPNDVARRALVIATNGGTATEHDVASPADLTSAEFIFDVDSTVQVVVKDSDQAGNFALGPAFAFTVNDDVPPEVPGAVAVMEKRQLL